MPRKKVSTSVRNADNIWVNSNAFREEALHFIKHGYYCADPWGSPAWYDYWIEQKKRCIQGYTSGHVTIPGTYYFYLNFCPIQKVEDTHKSKSKKVRSFPDFWDGDYNYFWAREIAKEGVTNLVPLKEQRDFQRAIKAKDNKTELHHLEKAYKRLHLTLDIPTHSIIKDGDTEIFKHHLKGGFNMIVGKARRRGYSYKNAAIAAHNYFTKPNSLTILNAYEKRFLFPRGIMTMAMNYINFINEHTGWTMPADSVNKTEHVRASYIQYKDGVKIEKGFMSEILAFTCKDNPDVNRGKDAEEIVIEEAGAFGTPGLLKALYKASEDCVMAGAIKTGMITIFGTSGDISGGTADYADMYSRPLAFDLLPFNNIWDGPEAAEQQVGFFHPINHNMEGYYDQQGNSDLQGARNAEILIRKNLVKNGATSTEIQQRMQEKPLGPQEAFDAIATNNFPVIELKQQLNKVKAKDLQAIKGTPVEFKREGKKITAKPILNAKRSPIISLYTLPLDKRGAPVIYEYPVPNAPKGLYKIGYDPVRQDEGTSLAAIIVYKGVHKNTQYHSVIVAEYIGRLESPDDIDRVAEYFADFYNTEIMHENEVTGVKNFFRRIKRLNLLASQPDLVISSNIKNSSVARVYGCHMTAKLKDAGERYVKEWLLSTLNYDENGNKVRVLDQIYSVRLLEELIAYNRKGNFDLISALFMCMFQVQEEEIGKEYSNNMKNKNATKLLAMMDTMYQK